jgi:hypothetical protein
MASEVQNGKGILFGVTNSGSPITMTGYATFILDTAKGAHKFKLTSIEDENEFDAALIATNTHIEMDITWTPSGATRTAAAATAVFLDPLSKVTLANFAVDAFNGDYVYVGDQSIDVSHGAAKMSLKVRKYADGTQNSSLTNTVSG